MVIVSRNSLPRYLFSRWGVRGIANFYSPQGKFFSNFRENKFTRYFQFAIISLSTQARCLQIKLSFNRCIKDKEKRRNEEEQKKWKEGSSVSLCLSRSSSRVFLTRVTRPLSGFQIRNTLGAEGFPIFPLFIARVATRTIEYAAKQRNSDVIRLRRRQVYVLQEHFSVMRQASSRTRKRHWKNAN